MVWMPRSRGRRLGFLLAYGAFLYGVLLAGFKFFWLFHAGVLLYEVPKVWDAYFPELRQSGAVTSDLRKSDGHFDVLMLGASVLAPPFGTVEPHIKDVLRERLGMRGRVWNLAAVGHTSRDSLIKYRLLENKHFDLVLIYDAINDIRMNNCRAEDFREDYTHSRRYAGYERHVHENVNVVDMQQQASLFSDLVAGGSMENLREFGRDMKTPPVYRKNIEEIIELTRMRGGRIVLMTFASHVPEGYTRADFDARLLDYDYRKDGRSCPVELWGEPDAVRQTLAAHNRELRDLARAHPEALLVDMEAAIPQDSKHFVDPCHLTAAGGRKFVDVLKPIIEQAIDDWEQVQ
jgi:hypothetical protein